ncbi:inositol monophosphatase family protein [Algiphilus sp.]|uniref:inositol monophosphatase family protein n=1 Tax=Algiphilus sp. TaxID=1872431 RepID=UPI0025C4318A|nr:inositol monophosphatase family protein [Algiphilus sp.]MCK5770050.1 inositol monophosphatase family protein [Algiphilus sp.]
MAAAGDRALLTGLVHAAEAAGAAAARCRDRGLGVAEKAGGEIVTTADRASGGVLYEHFARLLPGVPVVSEEGTERAPGPGARIVADELDGTAPFAAGAPDWGVMVALVDEAPLAAVIHLPALGATIAAERGAGCRINGEPVRVRCGADPADIVLGLEINARLDDADWDRLRAVTRTVRTARCTACSASSTLALLRGVTGAYLNLRGGRIWDFAAPALVIAEAGGTVRDPGGGALRWDAIPMGFAAAANAALLTRLVTVMDAAAASC